MTDPRELLDTYAATLPPLVALEPREHAAPKAFAGLRAVLDLHKPREAIGGGDEERITVCDHSGDLWPCATVQAVTKALGGEQ